MAANRVVSIRPSDLEIVAAFEIALSQLGIHRDKRLNQSFVTIMGNKRTGKVHVHSYEHNAIVHCFGGGEFFFRVDSVEFTMLNGKECEPHKSVKLFNIDADDKGSHISDLLLRVTDDTRNAVIYQVVGMAFGNDIAMSTLTYLWKYPQVTVVDGQYIMHYEPQNCGVDSIDLWFNNTTGYTKCILNGNRVFSCNWLHYTWTEDK